MCSRSLLPFAPVLLMLAACSAVPTDTESTDDALTGTAGEAKVVFDPADWYDAKSFAPYLTMVGSGPTGGQLEPGKPLAVRPGDYRVYFQPKTMGWQVADPSYYLYPVLGVLWPGSGALGAGETWHVRPAGLRLALDRPLVWKHRVDLARISVLPPGVVHHEGHDRTSSRQGSGVAMNGEDVVPLEISELDVQRGMKNVDTLLPEGEYELRRWASATKEPFALENGKLRTFAVKTVSYAVERERGGALPDSSAESCVVMTGADVTEPVRALDELRTAVLPESHDVKVLAFGVPAASRTANGVRRFHLHRLDMAHVKVGILSVRADVKLEVREADGTWRGLSCKGATLETGTGVDLADGDYRMTTTARTLAGPVVSTTELSFHTAAP